MTDKKYNRLIIEHTDGKGSYVKFKPDSWTVSDLGISVVDNYGILWVFRYDNIKLYRINENENKEIK